MSSNNDATKAERLTRRRTRMLPVLAVFLILQLASVINGPDTANRAVDQVRISAWLVLSIIILLMLTTGGGWIYSRSVRDLANDETTRVHRDRALKGGFISSMVTCIAVYFISYFEPLDARKAVHLIMTVGLVVTMLWFVVQERRASSGG